MNERGADLPSYVEGREPPSAVERKCQHRRTTVATPSVRGYREGPPGELIGAVEECDETDNSATWTEIGC
jgi:hypothetical protein